MLIKKMGSPLDLDLDQKTSNDTRSNHNYRIKAPVTYPQLLPQNPVFVAKAGAKLVGGFLRP